MKVIEEDMWRVLGVDESTVKNIKGWRRKIQVGDGSTCVKSRRK